MIETMLSISSLHLTEASDRDWLGEGRLVAFAKDVGGWFIPVPDESVADIPADLADCFGLARSLNCDWLLIDPATPPLGLLSVYREG